MTKLDRSFLICYNQKCDTGTAPIRKNRGHNNTANLIQEGATPIEKNVIVVDEQGNEYEATYPKRAKGLVKNGRARFVAENKICLACPPNENLEDNKMSENLITNVEQNANNNNQEITAKYILEQIEKIRSDSKYIYDALEKLEGVALSATAGDIGAQAKAQAIETVVQCRETTNQQMLKFYEKLYDDLMTQELDLAGKKIELKKNTMLSVLCDIEDYFDEEQMNERADKVLLDIDKFSNEILLDKN